MYVYACSQLFILGEISSSVVIVEHAGFLIAVRAIAKMHPALGAAKGNVSAAHRVVARRRQPMLLPTSSMCTRQGRRRLVALFVPHENHGLPRPHVVREGHHSAPQFVVAVNRILRNAAHDCVQLTPFQALESVSGSGRFSIATPQSSLMKRATSG